MPRHYAITRLHSFLLLGLLFCFFISSEGKKKKNDRHRNYKKICTQEPPFDYVNINSGNRLELFSNGRLFPAICNANKPGYTYEACQEAIATMQQYIEANRPQRNRLTRYRSQIMEYARDDFYKAMPLYQQDDYIDLSNKIMLRNEVFFGAHLANTTDLAACGESSYFNAVQLMSLDKKIKPRRLQVISMDLIDGNDHVFLLIDSDLDNGIYTPDNPLSMLPKKGYICDLWNNRLFAKVTTEKTFILKLAKIVEKASVVEITMSLDDKGNQQLKQLIAQFDILSNPSLRKKVLEDIDQICLA